MTIALVGAGPGSADLLTMKAARLLAEAEVVVIDRLIDESVLALINPAAEVIDVGKRPGGSSSQELINELLVSLGRRGARVVRLKGGDPFLFGRGYEEALALEAAGLSWEVVPGVSSALAAPAAAGIPVTHRRLARGVLIVTGTGTNDEHLDFARLAASGITLVVLMGVARRATLVAQLLEGGLSGETPVAAISNAWTAQMTVTHGRLEQLGTMEVVSPSVLVIGAVAALGTSAVLDVAALHR